MKLMLGRKSANAKSIALERRSRWKLHDIGNDIG